MIDRKSPKGSWAKAISSLPSQRPKESAVQRVIIEYLGLHNIRAVHVPNGSVLAGDGAARAKQSNALKRAGVLPGFPDLILFSRAGGIGFVEVKRVGGKVRSPAQIECRDWLIELGHPYAEVHSVDEMADTLNAWRWTNAA
jgi:VRR-NUC domain